MKIATRNLLAEMMLEALDDHIVASAIHCLADYCGPMKKFPPAMAVDCFLQPAPEEDREVVLTRLRANPLLTWDLRGRSGRITLSTDFASEWQTIAARLMRFSAALKDWSPAEGEATLIKALRKGIVLFNHHLFFEVHEVLETQWSQETGDAKQFLQGFIQIAVAFYHLENQNLRGAVSLLQDGIEKITPYRPAFLGVELAELIQAFELVQAELIQLREEEIPQFDPEKIPQMRRAGQLPL
jgi:uncharacterized protein